MIDVHFTLTEAEYLEAQGLFMRARDLKARRWRWPLVAILILGVSVFFWTIPKPIDWSSAPAWVFTALIIVAIVPRRFLRRRSLRKRFLQEATHLTEVHAILNEEGYYSDVSGVGRGLSEWKAMVSWLEGSSVIIAKQAFVFRVLPKRVLSDSQLVELRSLLASQIGPPEASR